MKHSIPIMRCSKPASLLIAGLIAAVGLCLPVAAADYPSAVSIKAVLPENQASNASYFDLQLSPGEKQTVQLQINNDDEKPVVASVELNPATTGMNGTIIYRDVDAVDDSTRHPIGAVAHVRQSTVEIAAKTSALVDIDIEMPDETFDGVILGGLRVTADYADAARDDAADTQGQGIQIKNRFAYVIGLKLAQNDTATKPDFHLKGVKPGLVNYATAVIINIQNSEPAIAKNMPFSAQVFQKGSQTVLHELVKDDAEMAPNSNCDYVVDWGKTRMQPGDYRVLVRMQHEDRVWEWDEEFTVAAGEANDINSGALGIDKGFGAPAWVYVIGGLLLAMIILLIFVLFRLRGRRDGEPGNP